MFPNIQKRTTATIQVWASVILIILALVMSFMPIIKINTTNLQKNVENLLNDSVNNSIEDAKNNVKDEGSDLETESDNAFNNGFNNDDIADYMSYGDDMSSSIMNPEYVIVNDTIYMIDENGNYIPADDKAYIDENGRIQIKDSTDEEKDEVNLDDLDWDSLPKEVSITVPKLISSTIFLTEFLSKAEDESVDIAEWLENEMADESSQEALMTAFATFGLLSDALNSDSDEMLPMLFNMMITLISILYVITLILILPIILLLKAIIALVHATRNRENPEEITAKVSSKLTGLLNTLFLLLLFQCALPQISYAWGAVVLLILTSISVVMNAVIVRLPAYRKKDFVYANVVQGISLAGIIGYFLFFFSLIKTGILNAFLKGPFFTFIEEFSKTNDSDLTLNYKADAIMMLLYVFFVLIAISYIAGAAKRFSLSTKRGGSLLAFPIIALPIFILPTIMKSSENLYVAENGKKIIEESSLHLTSDGDTALILVLIGIIIMLLAEIAYIVVPNLICKDMTKDEMKAVLSGKVPDPNAVVEQPTTDAAMNASCYVDPFFTQGAAPQAPANNANANVNVNVNTNVNASENVANEAPAENAPAENTFTQNNQN